MFAGQVNGLCGARKPRALFLMTGTHSERARSGAYRRYFNGPEHCRWGSDADWDLYTRCSRIGQGGPGKSIFVIRGVIT